MKLTILGSSSEGNGYVLSNNDEALIIECGCHYKDVLKALGYKPQKIKGAIISHSHKDHAGYIKEYQTLGIEVYKPYDINSESRIQFGNFKIKSFKNHHGNTDCYGFFIQHPDIGNLLFSIDTKYIKYHFSGDLRLNHVLIEANYQIELLPAETNPYISHVIDGHMSIDRACEFIKANDNKNLKNIVLLHGSKKHSNPTEVSKRIEEITQDKKIYVAQKGMEIEL